eukprot:COSAG03_NODE_7889_length_860_cov_1.044678_2_plen_121_part_00
MVLSAGLQPGHEPAESIAGKFLPHLFGGAGAMVIITDGCKGTGCLHAYISKVAGDMEEFVPAEEQVAWALSDKRSLVGRGRVAGGVSSPRDCGQMGDSASSQLVPKVVYYIDSRSEVNIE